MHINMIIRKTKGRYNFETTTQYQGMKFVSRILFPEKLFVRQANVGLLPGDRPCAIATTIIQDCFVTFNFNRKY